MDKKIMAVTNFYKQKYFFEDEFMDLPPKVLDEIQILLVKLAEKTHSIVQLGFYDDGEIFLETIQVEGDFSYDEIGAPLIAKKTKLENSELFNMLENWYSLNFTDAGINKRNELLDMFNEDIDDNFVYDELKAMEDLKDFFEEGDNNGLNI